MIKFQFNFRFQESTMPRCKFYLLLLLAQLSILTLKAQQNLFNVPSGDITLKGKVFFQHQVNVNDIIQNNSTLSVGIGHHSEIGLNLYGFDLQHQLQQWSLVSNKTNYEQPLNPQLLLNFQKAFRLNEQFLLSVGTQSGVSLSQRKQEDQLIYFNYLNFVYTSKSEKIKWINSLYFGDKTYLGKGNNIGYMGGLEYSVNHKLKLSADAIYGNNASSVSVLGPCYYFSPHFALSAGWQRPFKHSHNSQAMVFELTFL